MRALLAVVAVFMGLALARPGAADGDPDVERGIKLVEDGDYDGAIFLLDATARRLAQSPQRVQELSQAYLHLGIAYLGKGHESAAKAQFREALTRIHDLSLSSDRFSPKVIDVFEAARAELRQAAGPAAGAPAASPATRKGGGGKGLLLVAGGAAVAGGVALAAASGGGASGDTGASTPPAAAAPTAPQNKSFSGNLAGTQNLSFPLSVAGHGTLEARLSWENAETLLALDLHVPGSVVATSTRQTRTTASLTIAVSPQTYTLQLLHRGGCAEGPPNPFCTTPFTLQVTYP